MQAIAAGRMLANPYPPGRIMIVDDDAVIVDVVSRYLRGDGHQVECLHDGYAALRRISEKLPDLVILDPMLPGLSGLEVCRRLRERWPVPVVMLTALGNEADKLAGFETGADDYVTKPFSPRELIMRVRAVLRWGSGQEWSSKGVLRGGNLAVDLGAHEVRLRGGLVRLTPREYDLLVFLMGHPGQAFTCAALLDQVWNWSFGDTSTVTVHVRRLREKLEPDPGLPRQIITVRGGGYRYEPG